MKKNAKKQGKNDNSLPQELTPQQKQEIELLQSHIENGSEEKEPEEQALPTERPSLETLQNMFNEGLKPFKTTYKVVFCEEKSKADKNGGYASFVFEIKNADKDISITFVRIEKQKGKKSSWLYLQMRFFYHWDNPNTNKQEEVKTYIGNGKIEHLIGAVTDYFKNSFYAEVKEQPEPLANDTQEDFEEEEIIDFSSLKEKDVLYVSLVDFLERQHYVFFEDLESIPLTPDLIDNIRDWVGENPFIPYYLEDFYAEVAERLEILMNDGALSEFANMKEFFMSMDEEFIFELLEKEKEDKEHTIEEDEVSGEDAEELAAQEAAKQEAERQAEAQRIGEIEELANRAGQPNELEEVIKRIEALEIENQERKMKLLYLKEENEALAKKLSINNLEALNTKIQRLKIEKDLLTNKHKKISELMQTPKCAVNFSVYYLHEYEDREIECEIDTVICPKTVKMYTDWVVENLKICVHNIETEIKHISLS